MGNNRSNILYRKRGIKNSIKTIIYNQIEDMELLYFLITEEIKNIDTNNLLLSSQ